MWISKFLPALIFFSYTHRASAQGSWPSPEVRQMHDNAAEYMGRGNYADAIVAYKQLMVLAPENKTILTQELATAYYKLGDYSKTVETIQPLTASADANDQTFQLLVESQQAHGNDKAAKAALKEGLTHFPNSGRLHYLQGTAWDTKEEHANALVAYIEGIEGEPTFAPNYKQASLSYLNTNQPLWGLLYAETYLAMQHDTAGDAALKAKLYHCWKSFFDHLPDNNRPATAFEQAVTGTYQQLTPVVSDGISVENLTMVRTRFLIEWSVHNKDQYPSSLFTYYDTLIRNSLFDIYNEWLFGMEESKAQYDAWNKFHTGDMERLMQWLAANSMKPINYSRYYNKDDQHFRSLFTTQKKKR